MTDKDSLKEYWLQIRSILMTKWDPIGVSDVAEAADEYDRYIGFIYGLLTRDASEREIADYLKWVEVDQMGLANKDGSPFPPDEFYVVAVRALKNLQFGPKQRSAEQPDPN